jgi:hypothetical protein
MTDAIWRGEIMGTQFVDEPRMQEPRLRETEEERRPLGKTVELAAHGSTTEAIGAAGAIVLSILGLAGILTHAMMAIATIVLGAAVLLDAAATGARHSHFLHEAATGERHLIRGEVAGGISAGSIAGIAGIVLGILALLGIAPTLLCAVAVIAYGAALLFGSAAKGRFASLSAARHEGIAHEHAIHGAMSASAGGEVLMGIGAVVLGILALLGFAPVTLVLIGLLAVGASVLLSGTAFGARMHGMLHHAR